MDKPEEGREHTHEQSRADHQARGRDRRKCPRQQVDTSATILLVNVGSKLNGRILDLSLSGCRIHTDDRFPLGIYTRVETEFCLEGLTFRLGGVIQAIHDQKMVGIRFLDLSERKRQQIRDLIAEMSEPHLAQPAETVSEPECAEEAGARAAI